jgi:hypothetical protein
MLYNIIKDRDKHNSQNSRRSKTMTTQKFNEERTFGIEIEFTTAPRETVASLMRQKGLLAEVEGWNHFTRHHWKVITDSSCGYELVSPVLKGRDGLNQLAKACEALKEAGAKVNRKCGLHVHHDVNDYDPKQIANIFAIYIKLENTIDTLVPQSRRGNNNRYCNSLFRGTDQQSVLDKLREVDTIRDIANIWHTRYLKINFHSYVKYGTLEFRQHSGTIEFEKIYNWVLLTQQMVDMSATPVQKTYKAESDNLQSMRNILRLIPAKGATQEIAEMLKWYRKRAKQLAAA